VSGWLVGWEAQRRCRERALARDLLPPGSYMDAAEAHDGAGFLESKHRVHVNR